MTAIDLWCSGRRATYRALRGLIYSMIVIATCLFVSIRAFMLPALYDISSDLSHPPQFLSGMRPFDALPLKKDLSNQAAEQKQVWPQICGRRYNGGPSVIFPIVFKMVQQQGWHFIKKIDLDRESHSLQIEAVAKSFYGGILSDIVVRLSDEGDTTFVDMRATSRYLRRDLGINGQLVADFMNALDTAILLHSNSPILLSQTAKRP